MPVFVIRAGGLFDPGGEGWAGVDETVLTALTTPSVLCSIPSRPVEEALAQCPAALQQLLEEQRAMLRELAGLASDRLHGPAERIRHTLWRDSRGAPSRAVSYTHEELAARATTDRSEATRVIGGLKREGVIGVDRSDHRIIVLDPDRLAEDEGSAER